MNRLAYEHLGMLVTLTNDDELGIMLGCEGMGISEMFGEFYYIM